MKKTIIRTFGLACLLTTSVYANYESILPIGVEITIDKKEVYTLFKDKQCSQFKDSLIGKDETGKYAFEYNYNLESSPKVLKTTCNVTRKVVDIKNDSVQTYDYSCLDKDINSEEISQNYDAQISFSSKGFQFTASQYEIDLMFNKQDSLSSKQEVHTPIEYTNHENEVITTDYYLEKNESINLIAINQVQEDNGLDIITVCYKK